MILHEHKTIFVHINKTGGSSIEQAMIGEHAIPEKHYNVRDYLRRYPAEFKNYFKFTFIRNPWDKVVSQYFFQKKVKNLKVSFEQFVYKPTGRVFQNQLDWITLNGEMAVDFVGRFENLQTDFDIVCNKIGHDRLWLPHIHKSNRRHYSQYYNKETRDYIGRLYSQDVEYFGYKF